MIWLTYLQYILKYALSLATKGLMHIPAWSGEGIGAISWQTPDISVDTSDPAWQGEIVAVYPANISQWQEISARYQARGSHITETHTEYPAGISVYSELDSGY